MRLATRLTAVMLLLVVATTVATALMTSHKVTSTLLPREEGIILASAENRGAELNRYVKGIRANVITLTGSASVHGLAREMVTDASAAPTSQHAQELISLLTAMLTSEPTYIQARFIAADGQEIVRVERSKAEAPVFTVPPEQLQLKADRPYFQETVSLADNKVFVSPIELNQEGGVIAVPHMPVIRAGTPIFVDGQVQGIVIINVDMTPALDVFRSAARDGEFLFLLNHSGDFLVHTDRAREFGFDLGQRRQLQDEFPRLFGQSLPTAPEIRGFADKNGQAYVAAVVPLTVAGHIPLTVIDAVPMAFLLRPIDQIRTSSAWGGAAAVLLATVLAVALARTMTRPLERITQAARNHPDTTIQLPLEASGEVGELARAFAQMSSEVRQRNIELQDEIEERKLIEAELVRNAERLRLFAEVIDSTNDAVITMRLDGVVNGWNPAAQRVFQFSTEEMMGNSVLPIVPADRVEEHERILAELREAGKSQHFETERVRKDGTVVEVSLGISPVRSPTGELVAMAMILRDITEQKQAEQRFRLAFEASSSGMLMADHEGRIIMVNAQVEAFFGYNSQELVGQPVEVLVPEVARAQHVQERQGFFQTPETRPMGKGRDLAGCRRDGTEFPVEIGLNPVKLRGNMVVLAVVTDISERKAAEQAILRKTEQLEMSNAELERFAYVASHDLRAPLRGIENLAKWISNDCHDLLPERSQDHLEKLRQRVQRMEQLLSDMLKYARAGRPAASETVDCRQLVDTVVQMLDVPAGFQIDVPDDLPTLHTARAPLEQIFLNLIGNALKHHDSDSGRISIQWKDNHNMVKFAVQDNGPGVPPEYREKIFEMFQTLRPRDEVEASGIGLAVVRKSVQARGGRIDVLDAPGRGARFEFTWPKTMEGPNGSN